MNHASVERYVMAGVVGMVNHLNLFQKNESLFCRVDGMKCCASCTRRNRRKLVVDVQ